VAVGLSRGVADPLRVARDSSSFVEVGTEEQEEAY